MIAQVRPESVGPRGERRERKGPLQTESCRAQLIRERCDLQQELRQQVLPLVCGLIILVLSGVIVWLRGSQDVFFAVLVGVGLWLVLMPSRHIWQVIRQLRTNRQKLFLSPD